MISALNISAVRLDTLNKTTVVETKAHVTIHSPPSILLKLSFPSVNVLDLKT